MKIDVERVGHELQDTLVELVDLALQAKQAHWNVHGRAFKSLHEQLDELTIDVRAAMDEVAERSVTIGVPPDGRAATVAKSSPLHDFPEGAVLDATVLEAVVGRLTEMSDRLRQRVATVGESDPVTQDLFIRVLGTLEKHCWMFQARRG